MVFREEPRFGQEARRLCRGKENYTMPGWAVLAGSVAGSVAGNISIGIGLACYDDGRLLAILGRLDENCFTVGEDEDDKEEGVEEERGTMRYGDGHRLVWLMEGAREKH